MKVKGLVHIFPLNLTKINRLKIFYFHIIVLDLIKPDLSTSLRPVSTLRNVLGTMTTTTTDYTSMNSLLIFTYVLDFCKVSRSTGKDWTNFCLRIKITGTRTNTSIIIMWFWYSVHDVWNCHYHFIRMKKILKFNKTVPYLMIRNKLHA